MWLGPQHSLGCDPAPGRSSSVQVSEWVCGGPLCSPSSTLWLGAASVRIHQSLPFLLAFYQPSLCRVRKAEVFFLFGKPCFPSTLRPKRHYSRGQCVRCHSGPHLRNNAPCNSTAGDWCLGLLDSSSAKSKRRPSLTRSSPPPRWLCRPQGQFLQTCLNDSLGDFHEYPYPGQGGSVVSARHPVLLRSSVFQALRERESAPGAVLFKAGTHPVLLLHLCGRALTPTAQGASHQLQLLRAL